MEMICFNCERPGCDSIACQRENTPPRPEIVAGTVRNVVSKETGQNLKASELKAGEASEAKPLPKQVSAKPLEVFAALLLEHRAGDVSQLEVEAVGTFLIRAELATEEELREKLTATAKPSRRFTL